VVAQLIKISVNTDVARQKVRIFGKLRLVVQYADMAARQADRFRRLAPGFGRRASAAA
jgi:hypothetical protein